MAALVSFQLVLTVGDDRAHGVSSPPAGPAAGADAAAADDGAAGWSLAHPWASEPMLEGPLDAGRPPLQSEPADASPDAAAAGEGANGPPEGAGRDARPADPSAPGPGWLALDEAYRRKAAGDLLGARRAFASEAARRVAPQRSALERAWIARAVGDRDEALRLLEEAAAGRDPRLAALAREAAREAWTEEAERLGQAGDLPLADAAWLRAEGYGEDPQRVALERAFVAARRGDAEAARARLAEAAGGRDAVRAATARAELLALAPPSGGPGADARGGGGDVGPARARPLSFDLYADTAASRRLQGPARSDLVVPPLRLRALWRPLAERDLHLYLFTQVGREVGSIPLRAGSPVLHSDDAALVGGGALWKLWGGRAGIFAQAGAATHTAPGRGGETELDVRGGVYLGLESGRCWPAPADGLRLRIDPCADLYGEAIYLSRFRHDVEGGLRGSVGATFLALGPVALGLAAEARAGADRNADWYDNFGELGAGIRARLLAPFRVDLSATAVAGGFSGREGLDPAPPGRRYLDLRLTASTSLEF
jgi:tetratricopeptide (TPR) repeat protein